MKRILLVLILGAIGCEEPDPSTTQIGTERYIKRVRLGETIQLPSQNYIEIAEENDTAVIYRYTENLWGEDKYHYIVVNRRGVIVKILRTERINNKNSSSSVNDIFTGYLLGRVIK